MKLISGFVVASKNLNNIIILKRKNNATRTKKVAIFDNNFKENLPKIFITRSQMLKKVKIFTLTFFNTFLEFICK